MRQASLIHCNNGDPSNNGERDKHTNVHISLSLSYWYICTCTCIYGGTSVCLEVSISNVIPESLDICPQLHLKQISQSSGITLLIHTPPDYNRCMVRLTTIPSCPVNFETIR